MMDQKNDKPKAVAIEVTKLSPEDPRLKIKKELLGKVRAIATEAMKNSLSQDDDDSESEMPEGLEDMMESKEPEQMLPENAEDVKKEKLKQLMEEMNRLKAEVSSLLEE